MLLEFYMILLITESSLKVPPYAWAADPWPPRQCSSWLSLGTLFAESRTDGPTVSAGTDIATVNWEQSPWARPDGQGQMVQPLHCRCRPVTTGWSLSFSRRASAGFVIPIREVPPSFCYFAYDIGRRATLRESRVDRTVCRSRPVG